MHLLLWTGKSYECLDIQVQIKHVTVYLTQTQKWAHLKEKKL